MSAILAALALLLLGGSLAAARPALLTLTLFAAGAEYLTTRAAGWPALDGWSALYAAALLLLAESAFWTLEQRWPSQSDPDLAPRRAVRLAALILAAVALDGLLLVTASLPAPAGILRAVAGGLAAAGCLALLALLAWSNQRPSAS